MKNLFILVGTLPAFSLFAQGDEAAPPPTQGFSQMLILFAIAMLFFYFILWRPEQKRRKAMDDVRGKLKKGDRVNAIGIIGTVVRVNEQTVILRMVDGAKIEVVKAAITEVTPGSDEDVKKIESE
jgi:preprotein translocase subunit YajC